MTKPEIASALPLGLVRYKRTPEFTAHNVPEALLTAHSVKGGVWGLLCVTKGSVRYCVDGGAPTSLQLLAGETAVIEPTVLHHVEILDTDATFAIEFYRPEPLK